MDAMNARRDLRRWLVASVIGLVVLDVTGGIIAIVSDVNSASEAWSGEARLAAPWPMILFQLAMTGVAVRARRSPATAAAALLAVACLVSAASGFFDGGLGAEELNSAEVAFQIGLILWTGFVGALAAIFALGKLARSRATETPESRSRRPSS